MHSASDSHSDYGSACLSLKRIHDPVSQGGCGDWLWARGALMSTKSWSRDSLTGVLFPGCWGKAAPSVSWYELVCVAGRRDYLVQEGTEDVLTLREA